MPSEKYTSVFSAEVLAIMRCAELLLVKNYDDDDDEEEEENTHLL